MCKKIHMVVNFMDHIMSRQCVLKISSQHKPCYRKSAKYSSIHICIIRVKALVTDHGYKRPVKFSMEFSMKKQCMATMEKRQG